MFIALVGLSDDLTVQLSPAIRLLLVLSVAGWALTSDPELLPTSVYAWLPEPLNQAAWLTFGGAILVSGFVNAGNMADGANGLLASIALSFFCLAYWFAPTGYYWSAILALSIFFVVNVTTGRIFLGDFGSYSVSASVAFSGLALYATGGISIWLLGSLVAYPCVELVRVTVSRVLKRQSPLQAGDDHLHNRLFTYVRSKVENQTVANSLTGCTIGFVSSVLPSTLAVTGVMEITSSLAWLLYFAAYTALHLTAYYRLKTLNAGL
jgi:UDP-N-acetylmuramyl pentapeptide phosphotransferase/UDP-N-acetylglucosamine-1-phosphate transferase